MKTFDDLMKNMELRCNDTYEVAVCKTCEGLGYTFREELVDYHKRDYATFRDKCSRCLGDGRVVIHKLSVEVTQREEVEYIPFTEAEKSGDPFEMYRNGSHKNYRIKIDKRNKWREQNYPELAEISYEKYDELLEKIEMIEKLKRNTFQRV